jgi:bacteriorhodopsin
MKWLWFAASAFAFFCAVMALSTIATLSQRTSDPESEKETEIAIMLCLYLLLWVVFAAALAESSIR